MSGLYVCVDQKLRDSAAGGAAAVVRPEVRRRGAPVAPRFIAAPGPGPTLPEANTGGRVRAPRP